MEYKAKEFNPVAKLLDKYQIRLMKSAVWQSEVHTESGYPKRIVIHPVFGESIYAGSVGQLRSKLAAIAKNRLKKVSSLKKEAKRRIYARKYREFSVNLDISVFGYVTKFTKL